MTEPDSTPPSDQSRAAAEGAPVTPANQESSRPRGPRVFGRYAFWIVAFPFIVYLLCTAVAGHIEKLRVDFVLGKLEHAHDEEANRPPEEKVLYEEAIQKIDPESRFMLGLLPVVKHSFPYTYVVTVAITTVIVLIVGMGYFRAPFRISWLSFVIGAVGIAVWLALTHLDREYLHLAQAMSQDRPSFNPFAELKGTSFLWQFLAIRFFGLVLLVPLIEEFFIRGFLMRYVDDPDWDELPLGSAKTLGWLSPTIYGVMTHLTEPLAALAWFSMVTWLYKKTGSIWDCVIAHAVTNLLLGLYVVKFEEWHLW